MSQWGVKDELGVLQTKKNDWECFTQQNYQVQGAKRLRDVCSVRIKCNSGFVDWIMWGKFRIKEGWIHGL